ncbi:MAG TPA: mechanosensitive ion channel family protein [Burkholderiales bacterium]|nr:mechanosensitive ion channel family protein [Burkholderiales bacterium]
MAQESLHETRTLRTLERAAAKTTEPEHEPERIAHEASEVHEERRAGIAWTLPYLLAALAAVAALAILEWDPPFFHLDALASEKAQRYISGALGIAIVLAIARAVEIYWIERLPSPVARFNLKRILRLVIGLALALIVISVLFVEWYAAVVSLGLISLILGFALQAPISSFIGWIYILARAPYRVGDRIQIGEARGDVIDVGYLDTTLWEIGGRHLSTDHPSGRVIKFPNTNVFSTPVFNYSWPLFPYIWNEVKVNLAYESDLEFVAATMQKIAEEELGETMIEKVKVFKALLARTPVDHLEVRERPSVVFRVSENTWIEAIVRYLVVPRESGHVRTRLTLKILEALNAAPDRVLFPKSNMR